MARLGLGSEELVQREPGRFRQPGRDPLAAAFGVGGGSSPIVKEALAPPGAASGNPFRSAGADFLAQAEDPDEMGWGEIFLRSLPGLLVGPGGFIAALSSNMQKAEQRGQKFQLGQAHAQLVKLVDQGTDPLTAVAQVVGRIAKHDQGLLADGTVVADLSEIAQGLRGQQSLPQFQALSPGQTPGRINPQTGVFEATGPAAPFAPRAQTKITVGGGPQFGTIPPGFMLKSDKTGSMWMEPIPGGPADLEQQAAAGKAQARKDQRAAMFDLVTSTIDRALAQSADEGTTGWRGSISSRIPGTPGHDLAATLETIEANIAFETLQAMRAASPTGGALGSVSEGELALLKATMGSLRQSQSQEQFQANLRRLKEQLAVVVHGPEAAQEIIGARAPAPAPEQPGQPKAALSTKQLQEMTLEQIEDYYVR